MPPPNIMDRLPRILEGGPPAVRELVDAARTVPPAHGLPVPQVHLIFGYLPPRQKRGTPLDLFNGIYLRSLGNQQTTLYLALFHPSQPLPPEDVRPSNLIFVEGDVHALAAAHPEPFVEGATSYGTYTSHNFQAEEVLALRSVMVAGASLEFYLFGEIRSQKVRLLRGRIARAGFDDVAVRPLRPGEDPVPHFPYRLKTFLSARMAAQEETAVDEKDPFVIATRQEMGRRSSPDIEAATSLLFQQTSEIPLTRRRPVPPIWVAVNSYRPDNYRLARRRSELFHRVELAQGRVCRLFHEKSFPQAALRRRPVVRAMVTRYLARTEPASLDRLWTDLARVTGLDANDLRVLHGDDVLDVIVGHERWDEISGTTLKERALEDLAWLVDRRRPIPKAAIARATPKVIAMTLEVIENRGDGVSGADIWVEVAERCSLPLAVVRRELRGAVAVALWQRYNRLNTATQRALRQTVADDLPALEAAGTIPPLEVLPRDAKIRIVKGALERIFDDLRGEKLAKPIAAETTSWLVNHLLILGIGTTRNELESLLPLLNGTLWAAANDGLVAAVWLTGAGVPRPAHIASRSTAPRA